ncbi:MAG TPA: putative metallopeptidase [Candidatus Angelobacter sp.]|nr:putative metallopeptidase [Candidatus Angelobacter sp.]
MNLILGGDPRAEFPVPGTEVFDTEGDWVLAEKAAKIGEALIESQECFQSLQRAAIRYLWKRRGATQPKLHLGKCQRPSGLLRYFSNCDFIVWFSANNVRDCKLTYWQMEALVFHELKHASLEEKDGVLIPVSVPHDWEGFVDEIKRYGIWKRDIRPIAEASAYALTLPFGEK